MTCEHAFIASQMFEQQLTCIYLNSSRQTDLSKAIAKQAVIKRINQARRTSDTKKKEKGKFLNII